MSVSHSLAEYKKNVKDEFEDLKKQADKLTKSYAKDERFWTLTRDHTAMGPLLLDFYHGVWEKIVTMLESGLLVSR